MKTRLSWILAAVFVFSSAVLLADKEKEATVVKVDPDTGVVRVLRVAAVHDSGTIINPDGARGQVLGGPLLVDAVPDHEGIEPFLADLPGEGEAFVERADVGETSSRTDDGERRLRLAPVEEKSC